jgi:hypothetical protein
MSYRFIRIAGILVLAALMATYSTPASAQGASTSTSLAGTVVDTTGAVIPGADILVKNDGTGAQHSTVSNDRGYFTVPALEPGTYTVTIKLMGFKTAVLSSVKLVAATPQVVKGVLEVGGLEETITVTSSTELMQTQSAAVQTTIVVQQIQQLPLVTRTALDFVTSLPGVQSPGNMTSRSSVINGLPGVAINITLDGANVQDNNNRGNVGGQYGGDGFFMYIRPQVDSVEEITVSTSTPGAESAGQGAVQMRFVTRAGSNKFSGALYDSWRNQAGVSKDDVLTRTKKPGFLWRLNTPYWFNKRDIPKQANGEYFIDDVRLTQPGFRLGGPIYVPKLFDGRNKAFFFFNWEWFNWPNQIGRTRYLLNEQARQGIFTYAASDGSTRTINLFDIARNAGLTSTADPTMIRLLTDIRSAAAGSGGGLSAENINVDKLTYSPSGAQNRHFPTVRLDVNLLQNHRITVTGRYNRFGSTVDVLNGGEPRFPGFPNWGSQSSDRYNATAALRSTIGKNMVNELRFGYSGGTTLFSTEYAEGQFNCSVPGCQVAGAKGWNLGFGLSITGRTITTATTGSSPSSRSVPVFSYEDTLSWVKGHHNVSVGASYTYIKFSNWGYPYAVVPGLDFGMNSTDRAYNVFSETSGNYPGGISSTTAGYARNLYSVLVGSITGVNATAVLGADGKYHYNTDRWQYGNMKELGIFVADSWQLLSNFTVTGGLRYELQFPFQADTASYARLSNWNQVYGVSGEGSLFKPGTLTGTSPSFVQYKQGDRGYNMDWNNLAPSIGFAWRPTMKNGILRFLLGRDPVFRGGYSMSYTRYGTGDFTQIYGANPGGTRAATRSITLGNLGADGLPVLLRDTSRLDPTSGLYPDSPTYPFSPATNESVNVMDPNLKVPYTHQFSIGWQREFGKNMSVEVRYVGNRFWGRWTRENLNGTQNWNVLENAYGSSSSFMAEFQKAQRNLQANIAASGTATFAYTGAPGTQPLPIFLAYFSGLPASQAGDPTKYTSANFRSSSFYNSLALYNPAPFTISGTGSSGLQNVGLRANAQAAGIPANFFQVNPDVYQSNSYLLYNGGWTKYDGLQVELRRRLTRGFLVQGSYVYSRSMNFSRPTMRNDFVDILTDRNVDHALKATWLFELPFGRGRAIGSAIPAWLDVLVGGWEIDGQVRAQSGVMVNLGNYKLVGITDQELQKQFKIYHRTDATGVDRVYMFPQDFILQSIIALNNTSATSPTGYTGPAPAGAYMTRPSGPDCVQAYDGQCAPLTHWLRGPWFFKADISVVKRFTLYKSVRAEARLDIFNLFNNINFDPNSFSYGTNEIGWQVTAAARDPNASQDPGGRVTSFGLRIMW